MILIGQYDSPFVRRVAVAMALYGLPFDHRPWSTFGDADKIEPFNPLLRVPVLVLDSGEPLVDTGLILNHVEEIARCDAPLWPVDSLERNQARRVVGLAAGISDKAVSLFYEFVLHAVPSEDFAARCRRQIEGGLYALEADRQARSADFWFGGAIGHADIAVAVMVTHLMAAHPGLIDIAAIPSLLGHAERCEALDVFRAAYQPFIPPA